MDNNLTYIIIGLLTFVIFLIIGLSSYLRRITLLGMKSTWSDRDLIREDIQDLKNEIDNIKDEIR